MTAHRKTNSPAGRPVLSLGTRKPRAAAATRPARAAPGDGPAKPTIKVKRTASRTAAAPGQASETVQPLSRHAHPGLQEARRLKPAVAPVTPARPPPSRRRAAAPAADRPEPASKPTRKASPKPATPKNTVPGRLVPEKAVPATEEAGPLTAPELSERQRRHLRGLAHALKPLVRLGSAGLTPAVARETARALADHELIKVKAQAADRQARDALLEELARLTGSALVHRIGHMGVLYRPRPGLPKVLIPD